MQSKCLSDFKKASNGDRLWGHVKNKEATLSKSLGTCRAFTVKKGEQL